jgi:hypothetical protein
MNFTVNEMFKIILPHIPENLVSSEVIAVIKNLNEKFPAELIAGGLFECPLGVKDRVSDLSLGLNGRSGREILAGQKEGIEIDTSLLKSPVWRQIRSFCEMWSLTEGLFYKNTSNLWLEFDLDSLHKKIPLPGVFFNVSASEGKGVSICKAGKYDWIIEGLECLRGKPLKKEIKNKFIYCLDAFPYDGRLAFAALMLSRPVNAVRVVVSIPDEELKDYLTDIKYPGDVEEVMDLVSELTQFTNLRYNLDISHEMLPKIGIECFLKDKTKTHKETWVKFLDHLAGPFLTIQEKSNSLLSWIGHTYTTLPYESEPSYIFRRISHIKVIYEKDKPLTVKAYPAFSRTFEIDLLYEKCSKDFEK